MWWWVVIFTVAFVGGYIYMFTERKYQRAPVPKGPFVDDATNKDRPFYDVAVVGSGPSGSCCGFFLAKAGVKTLVLEKKKFPRDKHCGDAVCKIGIEILHEMGIYEELIEKNLAKISDSGGFVSPSGLSFIGRSKEVLGEIPAALAIKRTHLDMALAMAGKRAGMDLRENSSVTTAKFDEASGLWTITVEDTNDGEPVIKTYTARNLVCADGAPSALATQLGYVKEAPQGICSRAFVEGGTHRMKADGIVFYNKGLLPGYAALFKHPNDELNYCCYIIPGNPKVTNDDLAKWHEYLMKEDPAVSNLLGDKYKIERMKAGSLRLGGIDQSYDRHFLVVGDAAGMIDPLTGEGIHTAMLGGKIAAQHLARAVAAGNYSKEVFADYQREWKFIYGDDFKWSMAICQLLFRYPILLDAACLAVERKGDQFLARWADIMTGRVPKIHLLKPEFVIVIGFELVWLVIRKALGMPLQQKQESKKAK